MFHHFRVLTGLDWSWGISQLCAQKSSNASYGMGMCPPPKERPPPSKKKEEPSHTGLSSDPLLKVTNISPQNQPKPAKNGKHPPKISKTSPKTLKHRTDLGTAQSMGLVSRFIFFGLPRLVESTGEHGTRTGRGAEDRDPHLGSRDGSAGVPKVDEVQ